MNRLVEAISHTRVSLFFSLLSLLGYAIATAASDCTDCQTQTPNTLEHSPALKALRIPLLLPVPLDSHCPSSNAPISVEQWRVIRPMVEAPDHRLAHVIWHAVAYEGWDSLGEKKKKALISKGFQAPKVTDQSPYGWGGENFFYMHRKMIEHVNHTLKEAGLPCIGGFKTIPKPNDPHYPPNSRLNSFEARYAEMQAEFKKITDPEYLKTVSLTEFGARVQSGVHTSFHQLWNEGGDRSISVRLGDDLQFQLPSDFDASNYRSLTDTYSSAAQPIFWKLHGFVDGLLELWLKANGYDEIAEVCANRSRCLVWKETWVGMDPAH